MHKEHFIKEIKRLTIAFGPKTFDDFRLARIWHFVSDLPEDIFTRIVNKMLDSFKNAPLPDDFREAARPHLRAQTNVVADVLEPIAVQCESCTDMGWRWFLAADEVLICCGCESGKLNHNSKPYIPILTSRDSTEKIDPKIFVPTEPPTDLFNSEKFRWWRGVLTKTDKFWQSQEKDVPWWVK